MWKWNCHANFKYCYYLLQGNRGKVALCTLSIPGKRSILWLGRSKMANRAFKNLINDSNMQLKSNYKTLPIIFKIQCPACSSWYQWNAKPLKVLRAFASNGVKRHSETQIHFMFSLQNLSPSLTPNTCDVCNDRPRQMLIQRRANLGWCFITM